ncbi:MAG: hypothetical protein GXO45_00970, partial [Aquificae bacterium]|nr:hypothetical protein [Aquificota bacterium]
LNKRYFVLTFPNQEVRTSFNDYILDYIVSNRELKERIELTLAQILLQAQLDKLKDVLKSLFSSVPYQLFVRKDIRDTESYYSVALYMYLSGAGLQIEIEDTTDRGRIDLTAVVVDKVYIFELKIEGEGDPIQQIKEKRYYEKYLNYPEVYAVGIIIDSKEKTVKDVVWERVK